MYKGRSICITGATGSLGRRLVYRFAKYPDIDRIVALARGEYSIAVHHQMLKGLLSHQDFEKIHWVLGDIRDIKRLEKAFHGCQDVVHCAALKRVDSILENPTELVQTNIDGVRNVLEASMNEGVKKVIFTSSDKAVNAENAYGISKAFGEELIRSFNVFSEPRGTQCLSTRWGNVLGSRGSVFWVWRRALLNDEPILLTSTEMTRFFISFDQAINLIDYAINQGEAGDTIIPQLCAYNLTDFLEAMRIIYGKPGEYKLIGKRMGGEKYDEKLLTLSEAQNIKVIGRDWIIQNPRLPASEESNAYYQALGSSRQDIMMSPEQLAMEMRSFIGQPGSEEEILMQPDLF